MKIRQMSIDEHDIYNSFKQAVIGALIGYGKLYELLHKQLVRKGRAKFVDYTYTLNNRAVRPILYYDIKDPSSEPYSREGPPLGLNQLFVGQSPYRKFEGDPADDSIYHDTCQIIPKRIEELPTYDTNGWFISERWKDGEKLDARGIPEVSKFGEDLVTNTKKHEKFHVHYVSTTVTTTEITETTTDDEGNSTTTTHTETTTSTSEWDGPVYDTLTTDKSSIDLNTETTTSSSGNSTSTTTVTKSIVSDGWYVIVTYTEASEITEEDIYIGDSGNFEYTNLSQRTTDDTDKGRTYQHFDLEAFIAEHGEVETILDVPEFRPSLYGDGGYIGSKIQLGYILDANNRPESKLIIFKKGEAILVTSSYRFEEIYNDTEDEIIITQPASYRYVPLMYEDTKDLTVSHVEFIDTWDERFELRVIENSYWYSGLIKVLAVVVSMAIAYFFVVAAGFSTAVASLAAAFSGIGTIGSLTGNKVLEAIGIVGSFIVSVEVIGTKALAEEALKSGVAATKEEALKVAMQATFSEAAEAFVSTAGFDNVLAVSKSALDLYFVMKSEVKPDIDQFIQERDSTMKITMADDGVEEIDEDLYFNDFMDDEDEMLINRTLYS